MTARKLAEATSADDFYAQLTARFDHTFQLNGFDYITGEQATSRLNEVFGVGGWSLVILDWGVWEEADEVWVKGEMTIAGMDVKRQQFGSQKIKRSRNNRAILDFGFDLKGATTDCLKKLASLYGVGLYLYEKESAESMKAASQPLSPQTNQGRNLEPERDPAPAAPRPLVRPAVTQCADCNRAILDSGKYAAIDIARRSAEVFGRPLCMGCGEKAKAALKAEAAAIEAGG